MKKYLVVVSTGKSIPEDGWNVAIVGIRLYVRAQDAKEARKIVIKSMEEYNYRFCRVTYFREIKERTKEYAKSKNAKV